MRELGEQRPSRTLPAVTLLAGLVLVYVLGTLTTVLLIPWLERMDGDIGHALLRRGPHRLLGRVSMIWLLLYFPFLRRGIAWGGRRDIGWTSPGTSRIARDIFVGFAIGAVTLSLALCAMLIAGRVLFDPFEGLAPFVGHLAGFTLSCFTVALIEETLARGIFFRSLARAWNGWAAALVVSLLFGLLHYARPLPESFGDGPVLAATWHVLSSIPANFAQTPNVVVCILNLTIFSLLLCATVQIRGTIWLAVGLHAGFVWIKHIGGSLTHSAYDVTTWAWLGRKTDATDSWMATVILLLLLLSALKRRGAFSPRTLR